MFSDADFPPMVFFPHPTLGKKDQNLLPELVWQEDGDDFWGTWARHSVCLLRLDTKGGPRSVGSWWS